MGYALSWVAVQGKSPQAVRDELQLRASGMSEEVPESDVTGIEVESWYVVIGNGPWVVTLAELDFGNLSRKCTVVFCNLEEHVMYSIAQYWSNGERIWEVSHEASKGLDHLEEDGEFPSEYTTIRDRLRAEQVNDKDPNSVDYIYDIPIELARAITGFRHDLVIDHRNEPFEVLTPVSSTQSDRGTRKPWWKRLFS